MDILIACCMLLKLLSLSNCKGDCGVCSTCDRDEKCVKTLGLKTEERDNLEDQGLGERYY
jgi:hypothetical protein